MLQSNRWQRLQKSYTENRSWKCRPSLPTNSLLYANQQHLTALAISVSPLLFVTVSVQTISLCMLNKHFSIQCPSFCKSMLSNYLLLESMPPAFSCFSLCFLYWAEWWWRCLSLWGPSSSIPTTAFHLMSFKMQAPSLWDWKKWQWENASAESIELKWNYFSWGRETLCPLRYWIALESEIAVAYIFWGEISEDIQVIH